MRVPADQITDLESTKVALAASVSSTGSALAAYRAAVQGKNVKDVALTNAIAAVAKSVYANPDVTDQMLAATVYLLGPVLAPSMIQ